MDRKNITIISLVATAFALMILLVLIQLYTKPQVVMAGGMQARGGDYCATISQTASDEEALWVLDSRSKTVGIYQYDNNTRRIELRKTFPIAQLEQIPPR